MSQNDNENHNPPNEDNNPPNEDEINNLPNDAQELSNLNKESEKKIFRRRN